MGFTGVGKQLANVSISKCCKIIEPLSKCLVSMVVVMVMAHAAVSFIWKLLRFRKISTTVTKMMLQ
jgi:hypothetical protein